jgi:hypothetical protein
MLLPMLLHIAETGEEMGLMVGRASELGVFHSCVEKGETSGRVGWVQMEGG